jgi:hypothetical protein
MDEISSETFACRLLWFKFKSKYNILTFENLSPVYSVTESYKNSAKNLFSCVDIDQRVEILSHKSYMKLMFFMLLAIAQ